MLYFNNNINDYYENYDVRKKVKKQKYENNCKTNLRNNFFFFCKMYVRIAFSVLTHRKFNAWTFLKNNISVKVFSPLDTLL